MGHPGYYKTGSLGPGQVFKNGRLNILKRANLRTFCKLYILHPYLLPIYKEQYYNKFLDPF